MENSKNVVIDFFNGFRQFALYLKTIDGKIRLALKDLDNICKTYIRVFAGTFIELANGIHDSLVIVENARNKMISKGYIAGDHLFSIFDIVEIDQSTEDYNEAIYLKSIDDKLIAEIFQLISGSDILRKRFDLISEGIALHKDRKFGGSVTLLLSQIEGLFNDYLVLNRCAYYDQNGNLRIEKEVIIGISQKLHMINSVDIEQKEIIECLITEAFVDNNKSKGFNKIRNKILHGSDISFNNLVTSTQIVLWLYVIVYEFYLEPIEKKDNIIKPPAEENNQNIQTANSPMLGGQSPAPNCRLD
jgi:hypothetical protein